MLHTGFSVHISFRQMSLYALPAIPSAESLTNCGKTMKEAKYDPSWVDEAEWLSAVSDDDW